MRNKNKNNFYLHDDDAFTRGDYFHLFTSYHHQYCINTTEHNSGIVTFLDDYRPKWCQQIQMSVLTSMHVHCAVAQHVACTCNCSTTYLIADDSFTTEWKTTTKLFNSLPNDITLKSTWNSLWDRWFYDLAVVSSCCMYLILSFIISLNFQHIIF